MDEKSQFLDLHVFWGKLLIFWIENQFYTLKSRFVKWMIHFTPRNAIFSKIRPYFLRTFWLSAIKRAHANMRSLNNGWQPARPSKRTCVLLMPLCFFIKTEIVLGIIYWLCPDGLKQKDPVRSPLIYSIDPRPPGINVGTRVLWCFMSSFCTFSLSTRHCSRWIPCICEHLKIVIGRPQRLTPSVWGK